jgi:hypothetical protein
LHSKFSAKLRWGINAALLANKTAADPLHRSAIQGLSF